MPAAQDLPSSGRALVVAHSDAQDTAHLHRPVHCPATFLAQIIANARALPQARARRRADASEVIAAYQETIQRIRSLNSIERK
jgi:hypothetical protein